MFTYGLMIGFITTLPNTIIYIIGGSTGGIDFIVFYYSKKKLKPFAALSSYLAVAITVVAFLVGTYLPYVLVAKEKWTNVSNAFLLTNFFSPILIATLLSV